MKYAELTTQEERVTFLKEKLASDPRWAIRAMLKIFEYQTEEEKNIEATTENNGVGFNGIDGEILTSFSHQVNRGRNLSMKQLAILFKKMPKYAKQLDNIVQNN